MTPVTLFSSVEDMYKGLRELITSHPEYKHFDNGQFRIVEIPPQQFPPVNEASVFILMEYHDIDVWQEASRWLVVAADGEHPDGYPTLEEAMQVLNLSQQDKPKSGNLAIGVQVINVTCPCGGYCENESGSTMIEEGESVWCVECSAFYKIASKFFTKMEISPERLAGEHTSEPVKLAVGDRVRPKTGCVAAGQIGKVTEIMEDGYGVEFDGGNAVWIYDAEMLQLMCPLCPDWDTCYPIGPDFFGSACQIDGKACCETCYNVYQLTNEETPLSCKQLWKKLYSNVRAKGYGVYYGYHSPIRDFAITGHVDGWPSVWEASRDGLERATLWLSLQPALTGNEELSTVWHKLRFNNEEDRSSALRQFEQWEWDGVQTDNALSLCFSSEGELDEGTQAMILQVCYCVNYQFNILEESEGNDPNLEPHFTDSPYGLGSEEASEE